MTSARLKNVLWSLATLACAAIAVFAATWFWIHRSTRHPSRAYNVSAQSLREWTPYGGRWTIESDSIHNDSDERGAKLVTGSTRWSDYTLQAELRFDGDHGDMGVVVRSSEEEEGVDAYNGYYAGLRTTDGTLVIGRADYGWLEARAVPMPGGVHAADWYRLTITAYGCSIAAQSENLTTHAVAWTVLEEHPCAVSGRIALRSLATGGRWRNIVVHPADEADYLRIRQHVTATSQPEFPKREAAYNTQQRPLAATRAPAISGSPQTVLPHTPPITRIGDLLELPGDSLQHVVLRGVVTLSSPNLFVQDSTGGVLVRMAALPVLNVGDVVEVSGRAIPGLFSSQIAAAQVRRLWSVTPLPPISVTLSQAASGTYDARYVEVEGRVTGSETSADGKHVLRFTDGIQSFRALEQTRANEHQSPIAIGSYVRVRGICELDQIYTQGLTPFVVLMGSADDAQVLANPPWWNLRHLTVVFSIALLTALLLQVLYFRVERWKSETITKERERLAHEIHDTMAQGFAGLGYQLQGMRRTIKHHDAPESKRLSEQLTTAYQLVRRCHEEASRTISMLAQPSPEIQGNLAAFLKDAAKQVTGEQITTIVRVEGTPFPLPLRVANALMHIGREAISNAAGHSEPTELLLTFCYGPNEIELRVRDNGHGFVYTPGKAGFGILGMQKRAREIGGTLNIITAPDQGTEIRVRAAVHSDRLLHRMVDRLKGLARKRTVVEATTPFSPSAGSTRE